jgi:hypothetical protein
MPNYTTEELASRASSGGKDPGRKAYLDALAVRARQGDRAALQEIGWRSGVLADPNPTDREGSYATADARNWGQHLFADLTPGYTPQYEVANDGSFNLGHALGGILKTAAPFASLIPGVGIPLGAALGAGGSALGGALHGDDFSLGKTLLAGGAGAAGSALLGGQGFHGIGGIPARLGLGGGGAAGGAAPGMGAGGVMAPGGGLVGTAQAVGGSGGGGGILQQLFGNGRGGIDIGRLISTGALVGGTLSAANTQNQANEQRQGAIEGATGEWNDRAPLRAAAMQGILALPNLQRPDLSAIFADPGNPYYRRPQQLAAGY